MPNPLPFSLSQREVWLDQRAWPEGGHLHIGGLGFIEGPLDLDLFRSALAQLVAENEALRLAPRLDGGQILLGRFQPELRLVDVAAAVRPLEAIREWAQAWMAEPFDLAGMVPPWRFALLCHSPTLHGLTIQFHHLVMDGWGTTQVMRRWSEIYCALAAGKTPSRKADPGYGPFIAESLEYLESPAFAKDQEFWLKQLPVLPPPLLERRYRVPGASLLPAAATRSVAIPRPVYEQMAARAQEWGITVFPYLIAVLALHCFRTTGRKDVVIGLPTLNRAKHYRETMGMFVTVLPLVLRLDGAMTIRQLAAEVAAAVKVSMRHQRYPLSELSRQLGSLRQNRDRLFDVLFSFERQNYDLKFGPARLASSRQLFSGIARYPLGLTLCEFHSDKDVELTLEAHPGYFSGAEADLMARRLAHLAVALVDTGDSTLAEVDLLPPAESKFLRHGLQAPACEGLAGVPYIQRFADRAAATPRAAALVWAGGTLDYGELLLRARGLAAWLSDRGAGRERIVAVAIDRCPNLVIALLAVSLAGSAFLPLDPDAPVARMQDILADSQAIGILTQTSLEPRLAGLDIALWNVDRAGLDSRDGTAALRFPEPEQLAYVLFTSGSTGRPKGVMVEHGALACRLDCISRVFKVGAGDRAGQCTQPTFDPALIELFVPLINGGSVALPPPGRLLPGSLGRFVEDLGVTLLALVPGTLAGLVDSIGPSGRTPLRRACCGGEVLAPELAERFVRGTDARLLNVYGPTEAVIFATAWPCSEPDSLALPVGRPIDGTRVYVLDERQELLPVGVTGEIYLGGQILARGYLHREQATDAAFVADKFAGEGRMYRTGDLGWLDAEGCLHFAGRLDRQVKLRGYRVELGEIESALQAVDGVQQAAAKLVEQGGRHVVHAWVAGPALPAVKHIRDHLGAHLPDYMLPAGISRLRELPLGSTGKVAYDLLPAPEPEAGAATGRPPSGTLEASLLTLWRLALKRDDVSVVDNFFDMGGDSLAALDILAGIQTQLKRTVPLFVLTEHPTVEGLARALGNPDRQVQPERAIRHLGGCGEGVPLYFAASGNGDLIRLQTLADALAEWVDLYMLQPAGLLAGNSFHHLARLYADEITAIGRPGWVAGFSVGGITALETARQLQARGFGVLGLWLVDVVYPSRVVKSAIFWRTLRWLASYLNAQELNLNGRRLEAMFKDAGLILQIDAMAGYTPAPYHGRVHLIRSSGLRGWSRWLFDAWRKVFDEPDLAAIVPGLHGSMFDKGNVELLASLFRDFLVPPGQAAPGPERLG